MDINLQRRAENIQWGKKTMSSINGVGKIGQSHVKQ